ncbi:MAG: 6-bladed beta-propeller [Bacteroidetes bacterium]|nr:6-bladed beta-propeller [Bacteroidota bacterium]
MNGTIGWVHLIGVSQENKCVRQTGSSMHPYRLSQAILVCLLFISCSSAGSGELGSKNFFLEAAEEQQNQERIWRNVPTERIAELPIDEEVVLYNPGYIIPDINGDVYVVDYGVYEILRFDSSGAYVRSYGNGIGKGPGEFLSITSVSIVSDSIISVIDSNNKTKSSFSKTSGRLVDSELFDTRKAPVRYAVTDSGVEYIVRSYNKFLFESRFEGNNVEFGELIENQDSFAAMLTDGLLGTHGNNMVFVPIRFPAILIYDVDGTLLVSKKTMAYDDHFEEPRLVRVESNGIVSYRGEGGLVTGMVNFEGDEILLHSFVDEGVVAVDVYESESAEYKYSFRLPNYTLTYIMNDRMYQAIDTTVVVFSIER